MRGNLPKSTSSWIEGLLGFVYPPNCQLCLVEPADAAAGYVCVRCWSSPGGIRFVRPPFCRRCGLPFAGEITAEFTCSNCEGVRLHFDSARSAVTAGGIVVRTVIHRFKYNRALWFAPFLTDLLHRELTPWLRENRVDALVPIPLHPVRLRERGYNQSSLLARALSKQTGIPVLDGLIRRIKLTQTQTTLSRDQRALNMRRAFFVDEQRAHKLTDKRVVLIDDVLTTGATANACARELRRAGAGRVDVWTVARGT